MGNTRSSDLFRDEVAKARIEEIGVPLQIASGWMHIYSAILVLLIIAFISAAWLGSYARKSTVSGFLLPSQGMIRVFTPRSGRVTDKRVSEGQRVDREDVLFAVDVGAESSTGKTIEIIGKNLE